MFLEKHSRFFRRYYFRLAPRAKHGPTLPIVGKEDDYSIADAIRRAMRNRTALAVQPNNDMVELIAMEHDPALNVLTLLFHRSSPDAADPAYRKRVEELVSVRQATKDADEEQAVSAHLVISTKPEKAMTYQVALEEIPGLSLSVIKPIISLALRDYAYPYTDKKGHEATTYTSLKADGLKSEDLESALKKRGAINYLTLTRTNIPNAPDSDGIAEPQVERIKYKIVGDPRSPEWMKKLTNFSLKIKEEDWDDVTLDISLDDDRHRSVKVDRAEEATEILFVRSELFRTNIELKPCSPVVIEELKKIGANLLLRNYTSLH